MKKILIALGAVLFSLSIFGQTNSEIAGVYIKKAEKNYSNLEIDEAAKNFGKAMKLLDTITKADIARLGALIKFELSEYQEAKKYAKMYFTLAKKKNTETYTNLLDLYVMIEEEIEKIEIAKAKQEKARLAREKEARRIDSLKNVWQKKADAMTLKIDDVSTFNKNNVAIFKKGEYVGIFNHLGEILVKADAYKSVMRFDGYFLLTDKATEPTKVFYFNTKTQKGGLLPDVTTFNTLSTHYGNVMIPRGNGVVVTYPNNSLKAFIYNVDSKEFVTITDEKAVLKELKKTDKIDKYNKDGQVKINKEWYNLGGHLGGGIYPLIQSDYKLYGFLCSLDGTVLKSAEFNGIGAFYNGAYHVLNAENDSFWINQNGTKISAPTNESREYYGNSKLVKLDGGGFQIHQKIGDANYIILGEEKLEFLEDFLRKHP